MTHRAGRLTLIAGAAAIVAAVAGTIAGPNAGAAPKAKTDFVIVIDRYFSVWAGWRASFEATGAIEDSGPAYLFEGEYPAQLTGVLGTIYLEYYQDQTFAIVNGTGAYEGLSGGGTVTVKSKVYPTKDKKPSDDMWPDQPILAEQTWTHRGEIGP